MGQYTQLTQEQRYHIYACMKAHFSKTNIASEIGVHKSTVSREMKRNRGKKGYRQKQAHCMAVERCTKAHKFVKMTPSVIALINEFIRQDFTPEQVSSFLARTHYLRISHESIYRHLLVDKARGGIPYTAI
jgi:IS30 family transposase